MFPKVKSSTRKWGAGLLAAVYLTLSFQWVVPLAAFQLNKRYIEKNLCENAQVVESDCHGKCFLNKQMVKSKNESPESSAAKTATLEYFDFPLHLQIEDMDLSPFNIGFYLRLLSFQNDSQWKPSPLTPPPKFV